jgi:plastocyanin
MPEMRNYFTALRLATVALFTVLAAVSAAPARAQVSGRVQVSDAGGRPAPDLSDAVIYLDGRGPRGAASARPEMALDARQFRPRVLVVPVGTTVNFPNLDPFNHNVFSVSGPNAFDLGLYGRGESKNRRLNRPGVVRVFCNIHPRMSAFIHVRDNAWYTQPGADGSFEIAGVPPGTYTIHVWHERAPEVTREITVPAGGSSGLSLTLDASGYRWTQHKNKYGQEYGSGAQRERY